MISVDKNFDDSHWEITPNEIPYAESFESETDLTRWSVDSGNLLISEKHFKHGTHSLCWNWDAESRLTALNPHRLCEALSSENGGLQGWIYNEHATDQDLCLLFGTQEQLKRGEFSYRTFFHLNYTGWRAFWFRFKEDTEHGSLPAAGSLQAPAAMILRSPSEGCGTLFLDLFLFQTDVPWFRHHDYQMPQIRGDSHLGFWDSLYYSRLPLPQAPVRPFSSAASDAFAVIDKRYADWMFGVSPDAEEIPMKIRLDSLEEYIRLGLESYEALHIHRDEDGTLTGMPLFAMRSDYQPTFRDVFTRIIIPLIFDYKRHHSPAGLEKIMNLFDFCHDQGWAEGSALGSLEHETLRCSGYCHAVYMMRRELQATGRLSRELAAMSWYINLKSIFNYQGQEVTADEVRTHSMYKLLYILCLEDSPEKVQYMEEFLQWFNGALKIRSGFACNIKPDYCGFHHRGIYTIAYAPHAFHTASVIAYLLHGTIFSLSESSMSNLKQALLTQRILTCHYDVPRALSGRFPYRQEIMHEIMQAYALLALCHTPVDREMAEVFMGYWNPDSPYLIKGVFPRVGCDLTFYDTIGSLQLMLALAKKHYLAAPSPKGFWVKPYGAVAIHRRGSWLAAVKAFGQYSWDYEASWCENFFGRYVSYGSIQLLTGGDPISTEGSGWFLDRGWDWCRWPGTTVIRIPYEQLMYHDELENHRHFSDKTYIGGTGCPGGNGMFAMNLHDTQYNPSFRAKKSVFFFDNQLLCLGSNIENNDTEHSTQTTLFQSCLQPGYDSVLTWKDNASAVLQMTTAGNRDSDVANCSALTDPYGNCYIFTDTENLHLTMQVQKSVLHDNSRETSGAYATAWLDHGPAPKNAGYAYTILIQAASEEVIKYIRTPAFRIIRKNSSAHIAEHLPTGSLCYAVFDASHPVDFGALYCLNTPAMIITQPAASPDSLFFSVADPDLHLVKPPLAGLGDTLIMTDEDAGKESAFSALLLELNGLWEPFSDLPKNMHILAQKHNRTQLQITCRDGLATEFVLKRHTS